MNKKKITLLIVLLLVITVLFVNNLSSPRKELEKLTSGPITLWKTIEEDNYSIMIFSHDGQDDLSCAVAINRGFESSIYTMGIQSQISDMVQKKGLSFCDVVPPQQAHPSYVYGKYDPKITSIQAEIAEETKEVEMDTNMNIWWLKVDSPSIRKLTLKSYEKDDLLFETTYTLR